MPGKGYTVLHLTTERGWRGGEQQVSWLTDGLAARGHECRVLCRPGTPIFQDRSKAGQAEPLYYFTEFDIFAAARIAERAREMQADLIHAHTGHAHALAYLACRKLPVPCVVSRRVDFAVGGNALSRKKYFAEWVFYIAISHAVRQVLVDSGVDDRRIEVVHSGINPSRFQPRPETGMRDDALAAEYGAAAGEPLIVNVAALVDHKDQATLLRAFALLLGRVPRARLAIAGTGELEATLRNLAAELGITERVNFLGYVPDVGRLLRAGDLFVLSSHLEGLCTSILDAMAVGLPVVATRTGGVPEIVADGVTGLLAPPRDHAALAQAMETMLTNPMLSRTTAAAAGDMVRARFTNDSMVDGTVGAYRNILAAYHRALTAGRAAAGTP